MIAEIMGVPAEDRGDIKRWSDVIAENLGAGLAGPTEPPMETLMEMREYFRALIEHHRAHPSEDLISALIAAEIGGRKLSLPNLTAFCVLLLVAGNETTTNLIGNAVRLLIEHPDAWDRLRAAPALWPSAIEEVLRFRPPVQMTGRRTTEDVELGEQKIEAGQNVVVFLASANRDPAEFPNPDVFDITREPNRHLAFGLGIHFCLGAPLARLEAKVALSELTRRLPALRRASADALDPLPGLIMHGVRSLPLLFDPA
jgi:cytochrome P450